MLEGAQPSRARGKGWPGGGGAGDRLQWGGLPGRGCSRPPLTSVLVQLPQEAAQLLPDLVGHGPPPHSQAVQGAHSELAGRLPELPRGEEDACGQHGGELPLELQAQASSPPEVLWSPVYHPPVPPQEQSW